MSVEIARHFSAARRFLPPRDGLAVHLDRANVHPAAGAVAAARNQIGEAHFVDLAQVRGHPDLIERARASERDHPHRIQLHPANGRDREFTELTSPTNRLPSASLMTGRTLWKPDVFVAQRILAPPLRSSRLVLSRNVSAKGPAVMPVHALNGMNCAGFPAFVNTSLPAPYCLSSRFGSTTFACTNGSCSVLPATAALNSAFMTRTAGVGRGALAPPLPAPGSCAGTN